MTGPLAIGIGCRMNCPAETIAALVRRALDLIGHAGPAALYTIADKRGQTGVFAAARLLDLDIHYLSRQALAEAPGVVTPSAAALARFGVASVSEAAALAGAGPGARLLLPRIVEGGATCAIACRAEEPR